jgi:cation diffusion facilitator CzcD-associated flavoprotein CzcO
MTTTLPRCAVIGAGSSGIAALKALHRAGLDVTAFEASDRVGGNWVLGNANGMSSAYEGLHINTSRERMEFPDFPMPKSFPDYPHHTHIARYFDDYVDHFGLRGLIRFQTRVEKADRGPAGGWALTLDDGSVERFDALLVANGHHWDARWPEPAFPGSDAFEGVQMHAHDYKSDAPLRGKDVVVLGMGNSAMDIAVESSYVAASTYLAARRGAWIMPKHLFGKPTDQLMKNDPRIPFAIRRWVGHQLIRAVSGPPSRYGLPEPDHKFGSAHPTVSGRILDRISHGTITPKPNIDRLEGDRVVFTDGSSVHADVVVYCTGYKITFPFFDESLISAPDNHIELFRRVFQPDIPDVFFIGLLQPLGAIMPLADAQGRFVADHLRGAYALPDRAGMLRDIERERRAQAKRYVASKRHTIQVDFEQYLHDLDKERKAGGERAAARNHALPVPGRAADAEGVAA